MNNYMVAHLWANEKKESARGSNFFFEGESIYSYGYHFEVGRIVRNKRGEKAYLLNNEYYSASTSAHQRYIYGAIPTGSKVFYVGYNMSDDGSMAFITSQLELIKEVIEKYKKVRTSLSYRDVWGVFRSLMDYIEFFNMGTPKSLLKKSANTWIGTKHELSYGSDKIKSEYVHELKRVFEVLLNHQALETLGTTNVIVDEICGEGTWAGYVARCQRWEDSQAKKEALIFEKRRKEKEADGSVPSASFLARKGQSAASSGARSPKTSHSTCAVSAPGATERERATAPLRYHVSLPSRSDK